MGENNATETKTPQVERLTYSAREACLALGVGSTTLWRLTRRRLLHPIPGLRHRRYAIDEIKRFVAHGTRID